MKRLKNFFNLRAGSLLESVVALTIISLCLLIAVMVYSAVFTSKTSIVHYNRVNTVNSFFYNMEINNDSLIESYNNVKWEIEEENGGDVKKVTVRYKDTLEIVVEREYYIQN